MICSQIIIVSSLLLTFPNDCFFEKLFSVSKIISYYFSIRFPNLFFVQGIQKRSVTNEKKKQSVLVTLKSIIFYQIRMLEDFYWIRSTRRLTIFEVLVYVWIDCRDLAPGFQQLNHLHNLHRSILQWIIVREFFSLRTSILLWVSVSLNLID